MGATGFVQILLERFTVSVRKDSIGLPSQKGAALLSKGPSQVTDNIV